MSTVPTCKRCGVVLSPWQRADAVYCSTRCRVAALRSRRAAASESAIPSALRSRARWVRHIAKRPVTVHGHAASVTDPRTWSTFEAARASTVGDGLGFVLNGDGIACVDLDHCLGDDGGLAPWAADLLARLPRTYVEVSPSGHGLHLFGFGRLPAGRVVTVDGGGRVEVYSSGRYMTVSGQRFEGAPSELAPLGDFIASLTA